MRRKHTTTEMMKGYIAESLLILMRTRSFEEIKINEITAKAGVNRSTYYRNFQSKNEIVIFYFKKILYEFLEVYSEESISLENYLHKMFTHFYNYKKELLLICKQGLSNLLLESLHEMFSNAARSSSLTFEEKCKKYYHTGGIYNTLLLWFDDDMSTTPERMSEITISILPKGFVQ
ncbi:TetR/AcrR family transcriptional regulator [Paenibacillus albus]|uniref:TetR/AcrR family transcriptional regulator n=1 Tax=Paenibacillus albus TaxID=2495582 RepID=A0A3Q8X757_9BACL|nr:TetR/AcrR family transcriptional regulator [Paenibacillus albus]AZN41583.1 TetR/AcrR family transcriptional regulator [Paenibacillus albus]